MARRLPVKSYAQITNVCELPALIEVQLQSFEWFKTEGLRDLFDEISPIESFNGSLKLYFPGRMPEAKQFGLDYWFEEPKYGEKECLERDMTFAAPLYAKVLLIAGPIGAEGMYKNQNSKAYLAVDKHGWVQGSDNYHEVFHV